MTVLEEDRSHSTLSGKSGPKSDVYQPWGQDNFRFREHLELTEYNPTLIIAQHIRNPFQIAAIFSSQILWTRDFPRP